MTQALVSRKQTWNISITVFAANRARPRGGSGESLTILARRTVLLNSYSGSLFSFSVL